jgi:hypothetical protein
MMPRILSVLAPVLLCAVGNIALPAAPASTASHAPALAPADLHDLDQVMGMLAMRRHGRVEFIEQHFLAVLSRPIESSGELRYDAPDHLEKRTLKPHPETLVLTGETLSVERAHGRRVMDLHAYPQVLPFVESIRATLAGDRQALERLFHLEFSGSVSRWSLTLVPLESKVKQAVSQVHIDGAQDQLLRVEIRQPDGDRSLMTLRPSTLP